MVIEVCPNHFKTQGMYNGAALKHPDILEYILDKLKTQEMCEKVVQKSLCA